MMNAILNEYVTKYYVRWLNYARYLCKEYGLDREAYDIFAESLLDLLSKTPETIDELLFHETRGDRKLFNYTKKIIRNNVLQLKATGGRYYSYDSDSYAFESLANTTTDIADDALLDLPEELFNAVRELEADFRDDSFGLPLRADLPVIRDDIKVGTSVFRHTPRIATRPDGTKRVYMPIKGEVYYKEGGVRKVKTKHFPTRGEARGWTEQFKAEILAGIVSI